MLLQFSQFSPFTPAPPCPPIPLHFTPPWFMSMGCTHKFLESSVSSTIFYLSPSILWLLIMLLLPCTFYPQFLPTEIPPRDVIFNRVQRGMFFLKIKGANNHVFIKWIFGECRERAGPVPGIGKAGETRQRRAFHWHSPRLWEETDKYNKHNP